MRKLEISLSDDEWEQLKLAVTVEQKKIATDVEVHQKAEYLMVGSIRTFTNIMLERLNTSTTR